MCFFSKTKFLFGVLESNVKHFLWDCDGVSRKEGSRRTKEEVHECIEGGHERGGYMSLEDAEDNIKLFYFAHFQGGLSVLYP